VHFWPYCGQGRKSQHGVDGRLWARPLERRMVRVEVMTMSQKPDDLCIPVDPHDYEHEPLPEPSDEFVRLADAGPGNDPVRVSAEDLIDEHAGD